MPQDEARKRQLTSREQKVVEERLKGRSISESMRSAGYTNKYIDKNTGTVKRKIAETFTDALERKGFTPDKFLDKLERLLECKKWVKDAPEPQPDNTTQMYALRLWADLAGYEPPKKTISEVNLNISERRAEQRQVWNRIAGLS